MARPSLRKGAFTGKGAKYGTEIRHLNVRGAKSGMAKKMESTGGTFGKHATAAFRFKARVKVSVESMGSSYACERDVPLEAPDRLSSSYFVQVDILTSSRYCPSISRAWFFFLFLHGLLAAR